MENANFYLMENVFGDLVRRARIAKNLSQRQLALRIGKSPSYINYVEAGKNPSAKDKALQPSIDAVDAIAKVLDIPVDEARQAAGYAPSVVVTKPRTVSEFFAAIERLGIDGILFDGGPEALQDMDEGDLADLYDSVRSALEVTLRRKQRNKGGHT
jgi:transcriptional regulator with XRE-family HTH domain